jgi:hypothetical protein
MAFSSETRGVAYARRNSTKSRANLTGYPARVLTEMSKVDDALFHAYRSTLEYIQFPWESQNTVLHPIPFAASGIDRRQHCVNGLQAE